MADDVIEFIKRRTESGTGVRNGRNYSFPGYSKGYVKSLDFQNAGKSRGDVNLTLSGDMLAAIELLKDKPGEIVIGFEAGTDENARAEGNQLGTYGTKTPNPRKARAFLGIADSDLKRLLKAYL